ncbi:MULTISPECIES: hypothetical protein [unclassified Pseudomonas]|uniref:hypothetical protein n=1 Tax=unclassified Pseudomonas TaxID=196821 RepID=UPI002447CD75|nr:MULTISPECIES: hypothetical protein [unclassified Pseudomonas]MDG9929450.1 hypothetical protein [Pseudomonas sp. GD04042]MDH0483672.1 hypothetical protein [Pseudomonas sp. GD04015]MDH0606263.1 hypothetical protein [Pseudomonas sp. GD03869]MDH0894988.1 hypothetical protein [Pseudomonas sp. GD03875]MDH1065367.1 hypothetical protein [Pseudomonas sp. GD03985]
MAADIYLRSFSGNELVLDENETRIALKFFFPHDGAHIDAMAVNDQLRSFAQALLVAGIDATYAMGYVEALFSSLGRSGANAGKLIKGFGKKAAKHWFKHARASDLMDAKIYESVRVEMSRRFRTYLHTAQASAARYRNQLAVAWRPAGQGGVA